MESPYGFKTELVVCVKVGGMDMERKVITATDGMLFTDGVNYAKKIFLSENADVTKWYEITEKEYNEIQQALEVEYE